MFCLSLGHFVGPGLCRQRELIRASPGLGSPDGNAGRAGSVTPHCQSDIVLSCWLAQFETSFRIAQSILANAECGEETRAPGGGGGTIYKTL